MIWLAVMRTGTVITLAAAILQLYDLTTREVKPNKIYSSREAARYLGISRRSVIELIHAGELKGKLIRGNYRIPGNNILEYLSR